MSIPHLEDLSPRKFLHVMNSYWEYEATEKLDGSQLLFGIDEDGFYTSRETKGGLRIYNVDHYEASFKNTYIRSAHIALENSLDLLEEAGLKPGCQVEVEVLYGEFPNVVQYSPERCFIIFLRTTEGDVNIDELRVKLEGQSLTIPLTVPFTFDGKNIDYKDVINVWEFARSPVIELPNDLDGHILDTVRMVEFITDRPFNEDISTLEFLETPFNRKPHWADPTEIWADLRADLMEEKRDCLEDIRRIVLNLKEVLLDKIVRRQASAFGPAGGWIEGVVFRHPHTKHMFKLVDKDFFLTIKDFYWKERNELFDMAKHGYNLHDLDNRLDKYEKDKTLFKLDVRKASSFGKEKTVQIIRCSYSKSIDERTKEIYASLYQQNQAA